MDTRFSCYGQASTKPSLVSRMMASFARGFRDGVDINLGVGYVNEKTIPVAWIGEALEAVAADSTRYRQAFNYGGPEGSPNLIDSLRRFLARPGIGGLDERTLALKRLTIAPCGATSVLDAITEVLAPGVVVAADPMYYIYRDALERRGFQVLAIPEDEEGLSIEILERKLETCDPRAISFFYVVTVNNPSATILSNRRRRALLEFATRLSREQSRCIPVFFDLAYELLLHDPEAEPFQSVLPADELDIAYEIGTLSKILAPGMRMGYLLGPHGPLMNAMVQKTSDVGFSAPLFVQEMASYLIDHHMDAQLSAVKAGYRKKAVAVRASMDQSLGPLIEKCRGGAAGFYFYVTFRDVETHPESFFFRYLARTTGDPQLDGPEHSPFPRVIYIPGEYCVQPTGDLAETGRRQLRISYGFEETPQILEAMEWMRKAAYSTSRGAL